MPQSSLPPIWELIQTAPADGPVNMAIDLVLMERARATGNGMLRVYGWSQPTVSFGKNERTEGLYSAAALENAGLGMVRRPTGGRALLHDHEITYSVSLPMAQEMTWSGAYDAVNLMLVSALQRLGVPARVQEKSTSNAATAPDGALCFAGISAGEIVVDGAKLVASAVWRDRSAFLQQGSLLLSDSQHRLHALNPELLQQPTPAAVLSRYIENPSPESFATTLAEVLAVRGEISRYELSIAERAEVDTVRETLIQSSWLWRR